MRNFWISLHLYAAAFLAPLLLFVAISGGLYLVGIKGTVTSTPVDRAFRRCDESGLRCS